MSEDKIQQWYDKLYRDVESSAAYSEYCQRAFGIDLSQQGFSDKGELAQLLEILKAKPTNRVVDLGCGSGALDKYLHDQTGAAIVGVDASSTAIEIARKKYARLDDKLAFVCGNMDEVVFEANAWDSVIALDTLFFSADMARQISRIKNWLKKGGRFVATYSEIRFDDAMPLTDLEADNTEVALAFQKAKLPYTAHDVTENLYRHMVRKYKTAQALKGAFLKEGNGYLFDYIIREAFPPEKSVADFKAFQKRYIYVFEKT